MFKPKLPLVLLALATIATVVGLAIGGCGRTQKESEHASIVVSEKEAITLTIGGNSNLIGRLEEPATVRATLFNAGKLKAQTAEVRLLPGTWLLPEQMLSAPVACPVPERGTDVAR